MLAAAAGGGVWFFADRPSAPVGDSQPVAAAPRNEPRNSEGTLTLPSRDGLSGPRGDLFGSNAAPVRPAPKHKPAPAEAAAPPPAPVAPPMPYRVAGQVVHDGPPRVVLAREDRVFFVREGDVLEGGYRVESIKSDAVTLVYTPLDERQTLAVASALQVPVVPPTAAAGRGAKPGQAGEGRPAQLRWEGPARVQAGSEFEVALKITADKLVRGSPLQLSYDAKLLEPVAVRAGEFFAEGSFTYRVNPSGSITVGAFGKGNVPDDAEFVVVTFKPIRAGAAELKLSSLVLQGAGGAVVHEPIAAFRTSITQ